MLFDSLAFLLFLPVIISLYWLLPSKFRWMLLLVASYFFYGSWKAEFLILIVYSTVVDYIAAIQIHKAVSKLKKQLWLGISLCSNFGVLFIFKYFDFFIGSRYFFQTFSAAHPKVEWFSQVLSYGIPVGISFYTFQTVAYSIDVYQGRVKPEKNIGKFALFVSYFPQLVAGPIERFSRLHPQLFAKHILDYDKLQKGFRLIIYGLFIKMVIADNIAPLIDPVFDNPLLYSSKDNGIALLLFSLQIYADFHGYSLIAIGVAKLMGVDLMNNFKTPYFSHSIKNFWSRWHISLSNWFRDYLYIPLGGNKVSYFRWLVNIMLVFIVSGIWHGANFTFIVWGAIHGIVYLGEQVFVRAHLFQIKTVFTKGLGILKTLFFVNLAWLFFRSDTLAKAYLSFNQLFGFTSSKETYVSISELEHSKTNETILGILAGTPTQQHVLQIEYFYLIPLLFLFLMELLIQQNRFDQTINGYPFAIRWLIYGFLLYMIMALSGVNFYQFIYFQF